MPEEIIDYMVYGTIDPPEILAFRLLSIWVLTVAVQYGVSRKAARRNPNVWSVLAIILVVSYAPCMAMIFTKCEMTFEGDLYRWISTSGCYITSYLYFDLVEDSIFGDMGRLGGLWHNWSFFVRPFSLIVSSYVLMHVEHGHHEHGAWRHPDKSMIDSIMETGKAPMHWPSSTLDDDEPVLNSVIVAGILSYGLPIFYYQVMWKRSICDPVAEIQAACKR